MHHSSAGSKRNRKIIAVSCVGGIAVLIIACAVYLSDYYRADTAAIEAFAAVSSAERRTLDDGTIVLEPESAAAGLIFYPGGKVEHTAYLPLMEACASEGILCALVEMPFNLAVLDVDAADGIQELYPEIESWYIGGHSLGGSMAAAHLASDMEVLEGYDGLILLGSYSTADLSGSELDVLSVYGSEDKVLNREKYNANQSNLPDDFTEIVLEGGCHAYFGMYGAQDGDGIPTITNEEQIALTLDAITELIGIEE